MTARALPLQALLLTLSGVAALGLGVLVVAAPAGGRASEQATALELPRGLDEPVVLRAEVPVAEAVRNWSQWFAVYVEAGASSPTPVAGRYALVDGTMTFRPDFPFSPGVPYRVEIAADLGLVTGPAGVSITRVGRRFVAVPFAFPAGPVPAPPVVQGIFPTSDALPANLLRFYVYFSNPMQCGFSGRSIALYDEQGARVERVFMAFKQELWSPNQKRLTVLLDPGRIKQGVGTNRRLGPALLAGRGYKLVVEDTWQDAHGQLLAMKFEKTFRVTPATRSAPSPSSWSLAAPRAGSREPLTLNFDRPLDHALLQRLLTVEDAAGERVPGSVALVDGETRWLFHAKRPWAPGTYRVIADTALEDLAGNNLRAPLDHPVGTPFRVASPASLSFDIRP